jgi:hypothetical protein
LSRWRWGLGEQHPSARVESLRGEDAGVRLQRQ